jgi:hypothetical protein
MNKPASHSPRKRWRFDSAYSLALLFVLFANLVFAVFHLIRHANTTPIAAGWFLVLSIAVFIYALKMHMYPLKVQDRFIRLEERMRLEVLAPAEWRPRIQKLTEDQLTALRLAADDEVVGLAQLAIEKKLTGNQIREHIQSESPDGWRG